MKVKDLREIQELRANWERGQSVQFFRETKETSRLGNVVIVLTEEDDVPANVVASLRVFRYFKLTGKWEVSCDYEGYELNEAIDKIVDSFEG